jgi:gamma-glutamyltranspeptidase/glutathione hydrolase
MEAYVGTRKGVEQPVRVLKNPFLVALVAFVLCSCGSDSTTGGSSPGGDTVEQTSAEGEVPEQTSSPGTNPAEGETTVEPTPPTTVAGPELRDGPAGSSTPTRAAVGTNGMVSSAHPLATQAGLEVLEDGGNAFDAAVAVAASLGVVEPYMSGIGGYGAMVVYDARTDEVRSLSAATRTPETLDPGAFRPVTPGYLENRRGAPAASTPGSVNDWEALWGEYGELGWSRLLEPAIAQAEDGFVLDAENAGWIGSEFYTFPPHAQEIYGDGGAPLSAGQRLVQEDLGRSLRLISEQGADAVYGGELGAAIASATQRAGGFLTAKDLEANRPEWREPVSMDYRGNEVFTAPPPTTAWNTLTRLGVMGQLDTAALGHNSATYLDTYAAVTEQAYYERSEYAADPEVAPTPLDRLLSEAYWEQQAANVASSASPAASPSANSSASPSASAAPQESGSVGQAGLDGEQGHTTHFVVADAEGNVVSATQTLGDVFGSKVMPRGTGIWINNSITYSQFEPAGNPLDVFPGRHRLPGISPIIILRDGRPRIALGTHGGYYIPQTTAQMIVNLIDFDMDVQQAISAPRISFVEPNSIAMDAGTPASASNALAVSGYDVFVDEYGLGNAHGLTVEYGPGEAGEPVRFTGGADPRAQGVATGY